MGKSAPPLFSHSGYHPLLSTQIYVWTQQFQSERKTLEEGIEEALAAIRRAGYRRVELTSDFLSGDLRQKTLMLLKQNELEMPTFYAGSTLHEVDAAEKSIAQIVEVAEGVKGSTVRGIVTNPSPKPEGGRKTDEELGVQARYLNILGAELRKRGIRLMVHHHTPELVEHAREWRHQLTFTDPQCVSCCVDVDWAIRGGQEPIAFLRETGSRLASIHLRSSRNGVWMEEFGSGDFDYRQVANYLKEIDFHGYLVVELAYEKETRVTRSLEGNLRLSRLYAAELFGL